MLEAGWSMLDVQASLRKTLRHAEFRIASHIFVPLVSFCSLSSAQRTVQAGAQEANSYQ